VYAGTVKDSVSMIVRCPVDYPFIAISPITKALLVHVGAAVGSLGGVTLENGNAIRRPSRLPSSS
jgi:hypothetical protein